MGIRAVALKILPQCNFCEEVSRYDFRTSTGHWAFGCEEHWREHRATNGLGIGEGQLLLNSREVRELYKAIFNNREVSYEEAFNPPENIED